MGTPASSETSARVANKPCSKRFLQKGSLALGTFLFALFILEFVLRLSGFGNLEIYEPDPKLYWKLKPNQNCFTKVDHKPVHINSHGTRGKEFQVDKPASTIRILSLGDSRTFGWGLSESETYSGLLEQMLQRKFGGVKRVEVINAGVNAWSYAQMFVYFRDTALQYKPDVVILADANLWTQFSEKNSPEFAKQFMLRVRLKNLLRRSALYHYVVEMKLKVYYEKHRQKFIPVNPQQDALFEKQQQKDPDAIFRDAIEGICTLARREGIKPVLLYLPMSTELNSGEASSILEIKRNISKRLNVPLADMSAEFKNEGKELYLEADPVHPNALGNEIVAGRLFETVTNLWAP
jgi:lysophospholipase L1-like esterase